MIDIRTYKKCVEEFKHAYPKKKLREFEKGPHGPYECEKIFSFDPIEEFPDEPPHTLIGLDCGNSQYIGKVMSEPDTLLSYMICEPVGTWNANGDAKWLSFKDQLIVAEVSFVQEQADYDIDGPGDFVDAIFALWKVDEGHMAGIFNFNERNVAARVIGLSEWPADGWQNADVWYGE